MMDVVSAVSALLSLLSTVTELTMKLQTIGMIIQKAQAEGRTTLTEGEWAAVTTLDDVARKTLQDAINKHP